MAGSASTAPRQPFTLHPTTLETLKGRFSEFPLAYSLPVMSIRRHIYGQDESGEEVVVGDHPAYDGFVKAFQETAIDKTRENAIADFTTSKDCEWDYYEDVQLIVVNRKVVNTPSKQYALVQHAKVFEPVIEALQGMDITDVQAEIRASLSSAYMYITLPERFAIKNPAVDVGFVHTPTEKKGAINIGIYAKNSFDSSQAMEVGVFGMVEVCGNGMVASRTFGTISVKHTADAPVEAIKAYVSSISEKLTNLEEEINIARQVGITRDQAEAYFREFFGRKALARIMQIWDTMKEENAWGLHSAITDIVTHERANPDKFHSDLGKAEDIIVKPAMQVELANGLILKFKEEDEGREAAKTERQRQHAEKMLRKAEEKAQSARDKLMAPENAPEIDLSQADPLPAANPEPEIVPITNPGPFGLEMAVEVPPEEPTTEAEPVQNLHPDLSDAVSLDDLPSLQDLEKEERDRKRHGKKNGKKGH